jgi:hypothetical protein
MKLRIELVPSTAWYKNLRLNFPHEWEQIRKKCYYYAGNKCVICGKASPVLNCHEVWNYNDETHTQKLEGFIALCSLCHHVKHIGLAGILAGRGELDMEKVIEHFMKVNNCDRKTFEDHKSAAFKEFNRRSEHKWNLNLGIWDTVLKERESTK